jgi:hypothetical protein
MGLPEGTIRSWLGHLRKGGYIKRRRHDGLVDVTLDGRKTPAGSVMRAKRHTVASLTRALGESGSEVALEAALRLYSPRIVEEALREATEVPQSRIRHSRTALFLYLLKDYAAKT